METSFKHDTSYLDRRQGRIAYDERGEGPLVVCVPGMGDLRSVYRTLAPSLAAVGYRVVTVDLRGHGDSDATFDRYDDAAAGSDLLALVEHLGAGPAILIGTSMGAAAAAWAAAERPEAVSGLVLIGPFVRDVPVAWYLRAALRLALRRPWGPRAWAVYYAKLYPGRRPADLGDHTDRILTSLRRPAHWRAFVATTRTSHAPVEARLGHIEAPTLVVMGAADPDFADPEVEARLVAERTSGEVHLVADAGHYPQAEYPERVLPAVQAFLARVRPGA
jgi:pimeloyl-ACP methyl ester carboxylesterase